MTAILFCGCRHV